MTSLLIVVPTELPSASTQTSSTSVVYQRDVSVKNYFNFEKKKKEKLHFRLTLRLFSYESCQMIHVFFRWTAWRKHERYYNSFLQAHARQPRQYCYYYLFVFCILNSKSWKEQDKKK